MIEASPHVSVCVCTFNGASVVGRAIESILAQSYGDFELIVVDDASSDSTLELVKAYREPRIRILQNGQNLGNARNRSLALRVASGELVKFVDQDDWIAPSCLAEHTRLMDANPRLGFSFSRRAVSVESSHAQREETWPNPGADLHSPLGELDEVMVGPAMLERHLDAGLRSNWIGEPTSVMIRRACLRRSRLFNRRLWLMIDIDLWIRLMAFFDVGFLDVELATRSVGSANATLTTLALRRGWLDRLWLLEGLTELRGLWSRYPQLAAMRRAEQKSMLVSLLTGRYRAVRRADVLTDSRAYLSHLTRRTAGRPRSLFDRL